MPDYSVKDGLWKYLREGREVLVWKLDGLSEYDARRPLVPTGTNLLGLVKHMVAVEADYFGGVFGRPFPQPVPWAGDDAEPNADMWATPEESREEMLGLYRRVWAHADATIGGLDLDAVGRVPWWSAPEVTLHQVLVHVVAEIHRHAGHADIVRELIDGAAGLSPTNDNLAPGDRDWWSGHRERVERAARQAQARPES